MTDAVIDRTLLITRCRTCQGAVRTLNVRRYADGSAVSTCPVCFEERSWQNWNREAWD